MEGILRITVVVHMPYRKRMELVGRAQLFHLITFDTVEKAEKVFTRLHLECCMFYLFLIHLFNVNQVVKLSGLDKFLSETIFFM